MATRHTRPARPRTPRTVARITTLGALTGAGGGDLGAAANLIADRARELSATWSKQVPASITVEVTGQVATITASAPPARPNELALRHPVFGDRKLWRGPNDRPFLAPAADQMADQAMARYAKKIDGWARKAGFE